MGEAEELDSVPDTDGDVIVQPTPALGEAEGGGGREARFPFPDRNLAAALAGWRSGLEHRPVHQRAAGLVPVGAHAYTAGSTPGWGVCGRQLMCFLPFLSKCILS